MALTHYVTSHASSDLPPLQIYSLSSQTITITNSSFTSNIVSSRGGAIYAGKSETLAITGSTFVGNEAGTSTNDEGTGGDVWADFDVELTVNGTAFSGSRAEYGGASIECCGGTIIGSTFSNSNSLSASVSHPEVLSVVTKSRGGVARCASFSPNETMLCSFFGVYQKPHVVLRDACFSHNHVHTSRREKHMWHAIR